MATLNAKKHNKSQKIIKYLKQSFERSNHIDCWFNFIFIFSLPLRLPLYKNSTKKKFKLRKFNYFLLDWPSRKWGNCMCSHRTYVECHTSYIYVIIFWICCFFLACFWSAFGTGVQSLIIFSDVISIYQSTTKWWEFALLCPFHHFFFFLALPEKKYST